jgi:hypothetical protein
MCRFFQWIDGPEMFDSQILLFCMIGIGLICYALSNVGLLRH